MTDVLLGVPTSGDPWLRRLAGVLNAELARKEPLVIGLRDDGTNLYVRFRAPISVGWVQVHVQSEASGQGGLTAYNPAAYSTSTEVDCRADRLQNITITPVPAVRYVVFLVPVQYDGAGTKVLYDGQGGRPDDMAFAESSPVLVLAEPPAFSIAQTGLWRGKTAKVVRVLGRRQLGWNSTSVLGDCAQYLDTTQDHVNAVVGGTTYYIVSDNANDDGSPVGTGARTVRIVYLDNADAQQVMTVTMNGTTAVSLGATIYYVQWAEVATVGSNLVSVGNISIGTVNGAQTVASTVEYIRAGGNRSMSGRYKVPTGFTAYLSDWDAAAISANMDTRLRALVFADDRALSTALHFQDTLYLASGQAGSAELHSVSCPAGCEIKVSAIPSSAPAGNRLDASFHLILVATS